MNRPRIALVGPSRPYQGGIADHTVDLAARLRERGQLAEHAGWGRQFPARFATLTPQLPAEDAAHADGSRSKAHSAQAATTRELDWNSPQSWKRVGRRLSKMSTHLVIVVSSPLQLPAIRTLSRTFQSKGHQRKQVTLIVHNVLPHELRRWDSALMRLVLRTADRVLTHSSEQRELARHLGASRAVSVALPFHPPDGMTAASHRAGERRMGTIGFFGTIRPYKGVKQLIEAVSQLPEIRLIVEGQFWEPLDDYAALATRLGVSHRVELRPRFATSEQIHGLLGEIDALVLPYRSATASQQPRVAFMRGVPVIASGAGNLRSTIRDDVDGIIIEGHGVDGVTRAIARFYEQDRWLRLRRNVSPPDADQEWDSYLAALT